jgi:hypothetical protein
MTCAGIRQPMLPHPYDNAHSNTNSGKVRIIRPHHPLYGNTYPIVRRWKHNKARFYIIQLPDRRHLQIPAHWTDGGASPLPENLPDLPVLTVDSIRELIYLFKLFNKNLHYQNR